MTLKGKVAIVTGGNSGIGKAVVLGLAEAGANIVIDYVAERAGHRGPREAGRRPGRPGHRRRRRRQQGRGPRAPHRVRGRRVRSARHHGQQRRRSRPGRRCSTRPRRSTRRCMAINLKSAFFGTQLAAKQMIAQGGGGRIINITSVHEDWPMPGNTPYCLSKGGMRMLTRTAGIELGPPRHHRRRRRPGRGRHPDQHVDDERPGEDGDARRGHPARRAWRSPTRSAASWPSSPATAPAT